MGILNKFKKKNQDNEAPQPEDLKDKKSKEKAVAKEVLTEKSEKKSVKSEALGGAYRILVKPLITEKVTDLGMYNKYAFEITLKANKSEVKKAIKEVYGVEPVSVHILSVKGKKVRFGRVAGKTKKRKKAIITLKAGEKIEVYQGV